MVDEADDDSNAAGVNRSGRAVGETGSESESLDDELDEELLDDEDEEVDNCDVL